MENQSVPNTVNGAAGPRVVRFRPADLVTTKKGYPVLYEVLAVDAAGTLRVRGLNWAPGYSATVSAADVRPVTSILSQPT